MGSQNIRDENFIIGLQDFCRTFKDKGYSGLTLLEVGCYKGESTKMFMDSGVFSTQYCVDTWNPFLRTNDGMDQFYRENIAAAEQDFISTFQGNPNIVRVKGTLDTYLEQFKDVKIDVAYIDAAHNYEACKADILKVLEFVKPRVAVCGHDYNDPLHSLESLDQPGVRQAVEEVFWRPDRTFFDTSWIHWTDGTRRQHEMNLDFDFLVENSCMLSRQQGNLSSSNTKMFNERHFPLPQNTFNLEDGQWLKDVVQHAMRNAMPYVLVFQDDVQLSYCALDGLRQAIEHVPDDAELLQLSWTENENSTKLKHNRVFKECKYLGMFILFQKGYQKVIDLMSQGKQIDEIQYSMVAYTPEAPISTRGEPSQCP